MEMTSTYVISIILASFLVVWPQETINVLTAVSLKIQIYYINYRMRWMAWRMHRQLIRLSKEAGWPEPPPFRYVNIWDRDTKS